jgi:hypothetical protein
MVAVLGSTEALRALTGLKKGRKLSASQWDQPLSGSKAPAPLSLMGGVRLMRLGGGPTTARRKADGGVAYATGL